MINIQVFTNFVIFYENISLRVQSLRQQTDMRERRNNIVPPLSFFTINRHAENALWCDGRRSVVRRLSHCGATRVEAWCVQNTIAICDAFYGAVCLSVLRNECLQGGHSCMQWPLRRSLWFVGHSFSQSILNRMRFLGSL